MFLTRFPLQQMHVHTHTQVFMRPAHLTTTGNRARSRCCPRLYCSWLLRPHHVIIKLAPNFSLQHIGWCKSFKSDVLGSYWNPFYTMRTLIHDDHCLYLTTLFMSWHFQHSMTCFLCHCLISSRCLAVARLRIVLQVNFKLHFECFFKNFCE